MNFYDKFALKCNENGIAPSAAVVEIGFHKSELTRWKKGTIPRRANLLKMAKYFNCDVKDLEGDEETKRPLFSATLRNPKVDEANRIVAEIVMEGIKKTAPSEGDGMSEARLAMMAELDGMTEDEIWDIIESVKAAKAIIANSKKRKSPAKNGEAE